MSSPQATLLWDVDIAGWQAGLAIAGRNLHGLGDAGYLPNDPEPSPTCPRFQA